MAGTPIPHVLVIFSAVLALCCCVSAALPRENPEDIKAFLLRRNVRNILFGVADEHSDEDSEPIAYAPAVNNQLLRMPENEDKPKNCFHFYVSRNMSSLLAEATKMLRTIRDRREREWILTFIYRIKSLAEHLRSHPESRNYDCLPVDQEETKKKIVNDNVRGQQQPELYFVDDVPKRSDESEDASEKVDETNKKDNQQGLKNTSVASAAEEDEQSAPPHIPPKQETESKQTSSPQTQSSAETASDSTLTESTDGQKDVPTSKQEDIASANQQEVEKRDEEDANSQYERNQAFGSDIVLSSVPDCNSECRPGQDSSSSSQVSPENYFADAGNINPLYQSDDARELDYKAAEYYQQQALKERIRKALLEELAPEIKKLKTVGGTEEDLINIWNSIYIPEEKPEEAVDFDYEETGAAAGDLNLNEKIQPDRTVAPSLNEVQNSRENSNRDASYEPYDDSDVLVQQLFDVRNDEPPSKTTKSLGDQNDEYLITSTLTPP